MTFKDRQLNSITFQALKMKFLNSMTRTNFVALIKYKFILPFVCAIQTCVVRRKQE